MDVFDSSMTLYCARTAPETHVSAFVVVYFEGADCQSTGHPFRFVLTLSLFMCCVCVCMRQPFVDDEVCVCVCVFVFVLVFVFVCV